MNSLKNLRFAYVDSISSTLLELEDIIPRTVALLRKNLSDEISVFTQYEAQFADLHKTSKCLTDFEFDYHSILEKQQRLMLQIDRMWREFSCAFDVLAQFFVNSSLATEEKAIKIIDRNFSLLSDESRVYLRSMMSDTANTFKEHHRAKRIKTEALFDAQSGQSGCFQLVNKSSSSVFVDELRVYSEADDVPGRTCARIPVGLTLDAWKSHSNSKECPSSVRIRMSQKFFDDFSTRYSGTIAKDEIFPLMGIWKVQADQAHN